MVTSDYMTDDTTVTDLFLCTQRKYLDQSLQAARKMVKHGANVLCGDSLCSAIL